MAMIHSLDDSNPTGKSEIPNSKPQAPNSKQILILELMFVNGDALMVPFYDRLIKAFFGPRAAPPRVQKLQQAIQAGPATARGRGQNQEGKHFNQVLADK